MKTTTEFSKLGGETDINNASYWHKSKRHFSIVCRLFSIVLFLSLIGTSKGQTFDWAGKTTPNESAPAIDKYGNVYMIGSSLLCPGCGGEMIITKFNSLGERLWRKRIAGKYNSITDGNGVIASGIAIYSETSIYIAGNFIDTVDFDPGAGVTKLIGPGSFIAKYDSDGKFILAKKLLNIETGGFDIDNNGNIYLTGAFSGTKDFNADAGIYNLTSAGGDDVFFAKYGSSGNFLWAKKIGGINDDRGAILSLDPANNIIISGGSRSTNDFDPGSGSTNLGDNSNYFVFLAKYDNLGNFSWIKYVVDNGAYIRSISVDNSGNIFAVTADFADYRPHPILNKYSPSGNLIWSKVIGTPYDHIAGCTTDASGNIYLTGGQFIEDPIYSLFLKKMGSNGNIIWGKTFEGFNSTGTHLTIDNNSNIYLTGFVEDGGVDLDPGLGDFIFKGTFLAKYSQESTLTPFITTQSEWKYLGNNATDQGTAWRGTAFNDASWPSGIAAFGNNCIDWAFNYGTDCYENTGIGAPPTTTYFRKKITILDKSLFSGFNMALLRDDGAVVYVNGVEVWRSNMTTGTITFSTQALSDIGPPAEREFLTTIKNIPTSAFVNGINVIAVEVHQRNNWDLSFNLKLWGALGVPSCSASGSILREYWSGITGKEVSLISVTTAPTSTSMLTKFEGPVDAADNYGARIRGYICPPYTGYYTFWIASDDKSELWLSSNDNPLNKIKISSVNEYTTSRQWTKYASQKSSSVFLTAGKKYYIEALHKEGLLHDNIAVGWQLPDGSLERPIPGSRLSPSAEPNVFSFISSNASWKYLDNGTNQGGAWRSPAFSEGGWKTGNAELGYGDGDEATIVSYGSNAANKYITTYFRKSFSVSDKTAISSLDLNLIRDDGAVVYLNGIEVFRSNMPTGTIAYTSLASSSVGSPQESSYHTKNISTANLVNGTNVIAVEIHQATLGSADLSFKFKLTGRPNLIVLKALNDSIAEEIPITESAYDLSVFPNPNTGTFTIEINTETETTEAIQIKIFDLTGRMLRDQTGNIINGRLSETINIENLNSGIYLVEVMINGLLLSKKIILEK